MSEQAYLETLHEWRMVLARHEQADGAEMFLDKPDRWFEDTSWACTNGHVSRNFLKCEEDGDRCLECHAPVLMIPPEWGETKFGPVMKRLRDAADEAIAKGFKPGEKTDITFGAEAVLIAGRNAILSLGAPPLVTGSAGPPPVLYTDNAAGPPPLTLTTIELPADADDWTKAEMGRQAVKDIAAWGDAPRIIIDEPQNTTQADFDKLGLGAPLTLVEMAEAGGHDNASLDPPPAPGMKLWEIGVAEIVGQGIRWEGVFVEATDEAAAEKIAGEAGYYRNLRIREAS